jgi:cytochrome c biogenesis protein CcmG, thiol:disulfide interchange protein DsbE
VQQAMKPTKADRKAERARARHEAERRRARRHRLVWLAGTAIAAVALVVGIFVLTSDGSPAAPPHPSAASTAVGPSDPSDVSTSGSPRAEPLSTGDRVPTFRAPGVFGGTVDWRTYAGRPAVLSVWAPWCPHCQAELPILDSVMRDHPGVGFVTIATAVDPATPPSPDAYLREHGLSFPAAVDDARGTLGSAFGIRGFPTIYLVGSDGRVVRMFEGEVDEATLHQAIASLD